MTDTTERAERHLALMIDYLHRLKDDHTPDGYPAVRMSTLTECEDMLRTQAERIASLEAERDQLRAEVERLRGERMVFIELVRDLLHVVDTIQPQSDDTTEIEMLDALTTRARSAIEGALRAIESAKDQK